MKKIISLLAVALFATTFATGCGKFKTCSEATTEADCKADKFEKDKFNCEWKADAAGTKKCTEKPAAPTDTSAAEKKACEDVTSPSATECPKVVFTAAATSLAGKTCQFDTTTNKCVAK